MHCTSTTISQEKRRAARTPKKIKRALATGAAGGSGGHGAVGIADATRKVGRKAITTSCYIHLVNVRGNFLFIFFPSLVGLSCVDGWGIREPRASDAIAILPSAVFRVPNQVHAWRCS